MSSIERRSFLALLAASPLGLQARKLKTIGVQLYTVRTLLPKTPLDTLRAIERIGYREVEAVQGGMDQVWPSLRQTSLKPVSLHMDTALFTREREKLPAALEDARQRGFEYVVCPYIAPQDRGGADMIRKLGETLNKAGEICNRSGLHLCYHNHAFEFAPHEGGTLLDLLMQTIDPKLASLELDIMWSTVAGVSPVSVLEKYSNRIALIHLKNVAEGIDRRYDEQVPRTAFRDVGHGVIDIPAVLRAAEKAGVKHYFVEQDQTPGDPVQALRSSYEYLEKLDY
jgi:sugar phosphate isomerase/epimerase